jgi:hypothetical protein
MNQLQEITIKVPVEIAQVYQNMPQLEQEEIQLKVNETISFELAKRRQKAIAKLSQIMDQASDEAETNGLNPEILEEILADE